MPEVCCRLSFEMGELNNGKLHELGIDSAMFHEKGANLSQIPVRQSRNTNQFISNKT